MPPPPSPGWDHRAVAWLLDRCPPEYRGYPVLRRHPQVLARLTAHHVDAALDAGRRATATARQDLTDAVGADAVEQTLAVLDAERVRLIGERRAVALRGGRAAGTAVRPAAVTPDAERGRTRATTPGRAGPRDLDSCTSRPAGGVHRPRPRESTCRPCCRGSARPVTCVASTPNELDELAAEIRGHLVQSVSRTGGHLGPNLGVVELTLAIHRVFDSPRDTVVFDTGHQSYVHKLLTGRQDLSTLRTRGGVAGYPCRAESEHDVVENSHASASLSWADGIAKAHQLRGESDRYVVAVIGDGALTGGMAWEALNNIATGQDRRLVVVVNDNERSYAPTIGGMAHHLSTLRTTRGYETLPGLGQAGAAPRRPARPAWRTTRCTG